MGLRGNLAIGGGLAGAAACLGIAVGGMVTAGTLVVADPFTPPASADSLAPFDDCDALLDWYVSHAVKEVGPWGWGGIDVYPMPLASPVGREVALGVAGTAVGADEAGQGASETGTNTQEAGVDEPDVAKTDGEILVRLAGDQRVEIYDVSGARARELGRLRLGTGQWGAELLLAGDRVLVLSQGAPTAIAADAIGPWGPGAADTRLTSLDIADPAHPRVIETTTLSGSLLSARVIDGVARVVTDQERPDFDFTYPQHGKISQKEARQANRQLVRSSTIEDWLPSIAVDGGDSEPLACDQVFHPQGWVGPGTITVTSFPVADTADHTGVAVTADGGLVYVSRDRLYVASTRWPDVFPPGLPRASAGVRQSATPTTELHAFALEADGARYVASGSVEGTVRDRWSLDEQDGVLRVAWTRQRGRTQVNGITTLAERDGRLSELGEIGDLGIDEEIQSARWFDDLAILVTFRQIDPLYTIDLSDPAHPQKLGELKIPGYSGYLHPIGEGRLLALGIDATRRGRMVGVQAATFDISDVADPRQLDRVSLGSEADLPAISDPRAFAWLGDQDAALTPVADWRRGRSHLALLRVGAEGSLSATDVARGITSWRTRALELPGGRAAVVDRGVRIIEVG